MLRVTWERRKDLQSTIYRYAQESIGKVNRSMQERKKETMKH